MTDTMNDPLLDLGAEWQLACDRMELPRRREDEAAVNALIDQQAAVEKEMAQHVPLTPEGAAALARVLKDYCLHGGDESRQGRICDNLITGLEGMGEAA